MDFSRIAFVAGAAFLGFGGIYTAGLYSAHHDLVPYRVVFGLWDSATTVIDELPNIRGTEPIHFLEPARYEGDGVVVNDPPPGREDDLILMTGFFDGDTAARLIRRDGTVVHGWRLRPLELIANPAGCRNVPRTNWNGLPHGTIAKPDGSIVVSFESCGMVKLDRCGMVAWATLEVTHHSPNWRDDGGIVVAGGEYVDKETKDIPWPFSGPYWEDLIYRFSADGKLESRRPMTEMFLDNDMAPVLNSGSEFSTRTHGEFHLNEVEELSAELAPEFPMFEAGDLLLSFRNLNMIAVTDAQGERVKWFKVGPWVRQHDPDFETGGVITVFDNHTDATLDGSRRGGTRIVEVNPATNATRVIYGGREDEHMYSSERGNHQRTYSGTIMINEAISGRVIEVDAAGRVIWEYISRYDADRTLWMHDAWVVPPGFFTVTDWSCPAAE
jgi:hypothetical protein